MESQKVIEYGPTRRNYESLERGLKMESGYVLWRSKQADFNLDKKGTALIIIDMQYANASRNEGEGKNAKLRGEEDSVDYRFNRIENLVIPNVKLLLKFFRKMSMRVIYITLGSEMPDYSDVMPPKRAFRNASNNTKGNREHEILDDIKPLVGECVINKLSASAFISSNIDFILKAMGIKYILLTGASTTACVESTFRDAVDLGYHCIIVEDACADWNNEWHNEGISRFRRMGGRVEKTSKIIEDMKQLA